MPEQPVRDELDQGATLLELAERCEKATGPDRVLDGDIAEALGFRVKNVAHQVIYTHAGLPGSTSPLRYTASIDAAMTLVPEGAEWSLDSAGVYAVVNHKPGAAATPAIALCIAALKARAERSIPRDALAECDGSEINPSNYGHDDVCNLNERYCAAFQVAERAIEALATLSPPASPQGVEGLREALEPFAKAFDDIDAGKGVWIEKPINDDGSLMIEHFRRARAALSGDLI